MKRLLYLVIGLIALINISSTAVEAAAKSPSFLTSLNPFRTKTAEELAAKLDAKQQKADKKLYKKDHVKIYCGNPDYQKACRTYDHSHTDLKWTANVHHRPITSAMLREHLRTIASYRAAIEALPAEDRPIANHRYRKLLRDEAATNERLAQTLLAEAATTEEAWQARERQEAAWRAMLGVGPDASVHDIGKAYRRITLTAHPDRGGDRDKWDQLQAAYTGLTTK